MKSCLILLLLVCPVFAGLLNAQDPPKRPSNIDVSDFDTFKNNSFDILDQSTKANGDIKTLDKEIKDYAGVISTLKVDKLKKDYQAISELNRFRKTLVEKIGKLDEQGKEVLNSAKSFTPKMKSMSAVSNTNKSIKSLDHSKTNLSSVASLLKEDADLLGKELKSRGETVEEFVE
jgi:hypothetical protein